MTNKKEVRSKYFFSMTEENGGLHGKGIHVSLTGKNLQMTYIYIPAHTEVMWHSHKEESFVMVIQGGYELWVNEDYYVLEPGLVCWMPANTKHRARVGPVDTIEIEVFSPPREDWAAICPAYDFRNE
jgi:quercetin dioxygenase-like cupin family protein